MRILPFTLLLTLLSLSFCAQKEAPKPIVIIPDITITPLAPSDTVKKLVWSDEFDKSGMPDSTKWNYNIGTGSNGWGNNESQYYTKDTTNARVEKGLLIIEARKENKGGKSYTSARLLTQGKASWTFGRIEVKAKLPKGIGSWPAIWTLGTNIEGTGAVGWPACGEIDIMEHVGKELGVVHFSTHSKLLNWPMGTQKTFKTNVNHVSDSFHVYRLDWTKDMIQFFIDDVMYYMVPNDGRGVDAYPFVAPQFLLLNLAIGGNMGGSIIDDTMFPIRMEIDYVRIYQ